MENCSRAASGTPQLIHLPHMCSLPPSRTAPDEATQHMIERGPRTASIGPWTQAAGTIDVRPEA
ncbi:hypothetical protein JCM12681A_70530 [Streptomyces mexicanus]